MTCDSTLSQEVLKKGKASGTILVEFEEADQKSLKVPVDVVSKPKFTVTPTHLDFSLSTQDKKPLLRKIAIKKLTDLSFERLQVTLAGDWVHLVEKKESGGYIFLTFEFSLEEMPKYESVVYARLSFSDLANNPVECRCLLK